MLNGCSMDAQWMLMLTSLRSNLIQSIRFVGAPFVDKGGHVGWPLAVEEESFASSRMREAERLGMQHLSRTERKAILDILTVFLCAKTLQNFAAAILLIAE